MLVLRFGNGSWDRKGSGPKASFGACPSLSVELGHATLLSRLMGLATKKIYNNQQLPTIIANNIQFRKGPVKTFR